MLAIKKDSYNLFQTRPWGGFEVLQQDNQCKIKRLYIFPHEKTSLQIHQQRSEHWLIESGIAKITLSERGFYATAGKKIDVDQGMLHRIENESNEMLVIFEIQYGKYLSEDDIIRIDDKYGRV